MYGFRKGVAAAAFSAAILAGACATTAETDVSAGPTAGGAPSETATQPTGPRTAADGVYTAAQAERGAAAYQAECSACHNAEEFTGNVFQSTWGTQPVGDFHQFVSESMPLSNPGGLTDQQYADIMAYIIRQNGYPAGSTELPTSSEALSEIQFGGAP